MGAFISLWSRAEAEFQARAERGATTLDHTANRQFRARGVARGDRVYIVAVEQGQLRLLGRLDVEHVVDQRRAERLMGRRLYEAPDHLVGRGTELRLDRVVPEEVARRIVRARTGKPLDVAPDEYRVDVQSLRTTGRIAPESAALLDGLIDDPLEQEDVAYEEGGRRLVVLDRVERSPLNRMQAIRTHGTDCMVCGFSFEAAYGQLGAGFAEVHHLTPISAYGVPRRVDPATDLAVLCANCHRMVHRQDPPLGVDELRTLLRNGPGTGQGGLEDAYREAFSDGAR